MHNCVHHPLYHFTYNWVSPLGRQNGDASLNLTVPSFGVESRDCTASRFALGEMNSPGGVSGIQY